MMPRCIVDGGPLDGLDGGLLRCPRCGGMYAGDIFADADPEIIDYIIRERLACTECDQALPGQARVYANKRGYPIPCPTHAKRRRSWLPWRRWRARRSVPS